MVTPSRLTSEERTERLDTHRISYTALVVIRVSNGSSGVCKSHRRLTLSVLAAHNIQQWGPYAMSRKRLTSHFRFIPSLRRHVPPSGNIGCITRSYYELGFGATYL